MRQVVYETEYHTISKTTKADNGRVEIKYKKHYRMKQFITDREVVRLQIISHNRR